MAQRMVECQAYAIPSFDSLRSGETRDGGRKATRHETLGTIKKTESRGHRERRQRTDDRRQRKEVGYQKTESNLPFTAYGFSSPPRKMKTYSS